jgi:glutathione S-transferase
MMRLVTIPISHYCEKARWALDRAGIGYREERHVQGIHRLASRRAGGRGTVPVLVTDAGPVADSAEIIDWVDRRLPSELRLVPENPDRAAEVRALCRRFDEVLGPAARRLIYVHMLDRPIAELGFNNMGVPGWEDRALRLGWPAARMFVRHALEIRPGVEVPDEAAVWDELDAVAALLADGRPYLCGDRITAADVTFASLAAAVVLPPGYGVLLPQPQELPPPTAELVLRARSHPAGVYALRLFAEERHVPAAAAAGTTGSG